DGIEDVQLTFTDALLVAGADRGGADVAVFDPDPSDRGRATAFPGFAGGVRVAMGDFNGDGRPDTVVGTGPGGPTLVRILDGAALDNDTITELFAIAPFEAAFTGGVYVAAGDITGDGVPELVITPDEGGGPRVKVFNGVGFTPLADFFGIDDSNFRGGARPAVGDMNRDGFAELVVAAGFGGGPRVAVFKGSANFSAASPKLFGDFFVFEQALRNGAFIAVGDVNGDGFGDLVGGGGPGGAPRVLALSGADLLAGKADGAAALANFFAGDVNSRGGVRVATSYLDDDAKMDLVTGAGQNSGSRVTVYLGKDLAAGTPPAFLDLDPFPGFNGGAVVG
ncbi:MAG TPA: VCBS repeat-containing protein, partial [Gemmataceae bacterium]|nr:VCBS repeat-containing protein [Gemmataceae bacterium]